MTLCTLSPGLLYRYGFVGRWGGGAVSKDGGYTGQRDMSARYQRLKSREDQNMRTDIMDFPIFSG